MLGIQEAALVEGLKKDRSSCGWYRFGKTLQLLLLWSRWVWWPPFKGGAFLTASSLKTQLELSAAFRMRLMRNSSIERKMGALRISFTYPDVMLLRILLGIVHYTSSRPNWPTRLRQSWRSPSKSELYKEKSVIFSLLC